ncbi:unnamed protein product, partial [Mesorhabditis belari]|uniref:Innexin n=1 Tax=Mesorhabditis belari TaxID=2138241 RepID=A0AAF3ED41_9BILA
MSAVSQITVLLKKLGSTYDDDSTDRWHHVRTIMILIGLATTLFLKNYVGEPLQCWPPAQWNDGWEAFAEAYCFVENTYFVPMNQSNLPAHHTREDQEMIYYQWVPFILLLMGLLFYVPRAIWKLFSFYTGLTLPEMMKSARTTGKTGAEGKGGPLAKALYREHTAVEKAGSIRYGSYLSNLYLFCKTLMLLNVFSQLLFINYWLGTAYTFWGLGIFWDMLHGRHWQESGHFPRVTYCDVTVRELGNVNNWTLQCVLMVNMFNEKIFIFMWFYFAFLLVITFFNWVIWLHRRLFGSVDFIKELVAQENFIPSTANVGKFKDRVLKNDGLLLIRMIDENAGRIFASEVARELWDLWDGEPDPPLADENH